MKPKPPCPVCGDSHHVKTLGGGSHGKYRYECQSKSHAGQWERWHQVPPHLVNKSTNSNIVMSSSITKRKYRCKRCGKEKKNHVCSVSDNEIQHTYTPSQMENSDLIDDGEPSLSIFAQIVLDRPVVTQSTADVLSHCA